jgi:hypothetical protein
MDLRRIRYAVALWCLVTTIVLITYKLAADQKGEWAGQRVNGSMGGVQKIVDWNLVISWSRDLANPNIRQDLSTTLSLPVADSKQVTQWSNPYLLIDDQYLIPLSTTVYDGMRTWVVKVFDSPLVVYYRYELPTGRWYTYLYELISNSSRELDQLTMVGKVWQVFLFSIKQSSDSYHGLSAIIDGSLTTLYTGDYTTAQYLWDTLKLNNSQEIYLPLRASWS